jgi:peptidoglycan/xylan/chitin deacetylase (PgdA/CDA1 family)
MYHLVAVTPHDAPYPDLYVSPMAFADQLRYLKTHGYHPLTLRRVYDCWHGAGELPDKPVVLSFDDGYLCDYTIVAPLLADYRWPGVLNLTARTISPGGDLTPDQVKVLLRLGWEIDAHSMDHADLTTLTAGQLETEVSGARTVLRTQLHAPVDFFCYPSGRYDDTVVAEVQAAGYLGATTTVAGLATPDQPFELRRQRVDSQMTLDAFGALLSP